MRASPSNPSIRAWRRQLLEARWGVKARFLVVLTAACLGLQQLLFTTTMHHGHLGPWQALRLRVSALLSPAYAASRASAEDTTNWQELWPLPEVRPSCQALHTTLDTALGSAANESGGDAWRTMLGIGGADCCAAAFDVPKVALMFLTKAAMPHEALWAAWFRSAHGRLPRVAAAEALCSGLGGGPPAALTLLRTLCAEEESGVSKVEAVILGQHLFSVYVHASPFIEAFSNTSIFAGHLIPTRVEAFWGTFRLVLATKLLLRQALQEPSNSHFVLLSESDVPLYPPTTVYAQLLHEGKARIDACGVEDTSRWRYTKALSSYGVLPDTWRKSWQWFSLTRPLAAVVVADVHLHRAFERHCNPPPHEAARVGGPDCYSDEHYIPTLLSVSGLENQTSCARTITNVDWRMGGAHPRTFGPDDVTALRMRLLRRPFVGCRYNAAIQSSADLFVDLRANSPPLDADECAAAREPPRWRNPLGTQCPLFARKFPSETAPGLMQLYASCRAALHVLAETDARCAKAAV